MTKPILYFFIKLTTSILVFFLFHLAASAQGGFIGLHSSSFLRVNNNEVKSINGFVEKENRFSGNSIGVVMDIYSLTRMSHLSFGFEVSRVEYQKEIQGIFPESNTYGTAWLENSATYYLLPISLTTATGRNSASTIVISYIPGILKKSEGLQTIKLGGAVNSSYIDAYALDNLKFRQSCRLAYSIAIGFSGKVKIQLLPFVEVGSSCFRQSKKNEVVALGMSGSIMIKPF